MQNKKFIFIGSYVGESVSGSHRQERFIIKALELKLEVVLLKTSGNWIGIHVYKSLKDFEKWKQLNQPSLFVGSISTNRFKKYLIKLKYLLFFDIIGYGFFSTFKLLYKNNKLFDNNYFILVSSPSISSAVSIYLYSIFFNKKIKYSIDMRDAWANHKSIKIFKKIRKRIEYKVLKRATHVLTVSKYLKEEFEENYAINVDLLYNINLNLINQNIILPNRDNTLLSKSIFNFSYFGSLPMDFYDLNTFCAGLSNFIIYNPQFKNKFYFHFYGPCGELQKILADYPNIKDFFLFYNSISHSQAISLMKSSDAVLFFGFNAEKNAGVVSTKIFEYFYLRVKIIAFDIRMNSDLEWLFKNACGKSILLNNAKDFSNYLKSMFIDINILPSCINNKFLIELDKSYEMFFREKIII
jgi:hypothetical protein